MPSQRGLWLGDSLKLPQNSETGMLRRLLLGLTEGLVVGLTLAVLSARQLGLPAPGGVVAALLGALTGLVIGLVAGRPVWARNAKTEALLKAGVGAVLGVGLSFVVRRWLHVSVDLKALALGAGPAGQLSIVTLPAVGTALALFFELDNDGASGTSPRASAPQRVAGAVASVEDLPEPEALDDEVEHKLEKR